jgi:3-hydroxyacyl-CoA dehydrogenase
MDIGIRRVAVLGAGVMGQGIAAHLANAGIPSYLFDIAPDELTDAESAAGLALEDRRVRNRVSKSGIDALVKSKPALIYRKDMVELITPCNYADDLERLGECDWIVEVVVERLDIKQRVFEMVEEHRRPGSIVSSNTSGLSVAAMAEGRSDDFRRHFMVTHFFNPVRYMRLLEIVPCADTDPEVFAGMAEFGEQVLGKGVVYAKDTPNFIANRIGTFGMASVFHWISELGIGITETDKVFGAVMGRPKSAVFRTADVVGLDTMAHVFGTIAEGCPDDPWRGRFALPDAMSRLVADGRLGAKTGAGFYKKTRDTDGKTAIVALDLETLDYVEQPKVKLASIGAARGKDTTAEKIAEMVWFDDVHGTLAWNVTAETCIYSAQLLGEIADDVVNIDRGLRWGFGYELGPFETWDAIGVEQSVERMRSEGMEVPPAVDRLLELGEGTWYVTRGGTRMFWDVVAEEYTPIPIDDRMVSLPLLRTADKVIAANVGATLLDMGDGVGCVEFHTKMNAIDAQIVEMIEIACQMVDDGELVGFVVGNEATNFSVGANVGLIGMLAMSKDWDQIDAAVAAMQQSYLRMKYCNGPVVIAPRGMALGGGCEAVMHGDAVRAAAESYIGLVELGVGLIPAAGGCKEMVLRSYGSIPTGVKADWMPFLEKAFTTVGTGTVSTSADEARDLGFLRPNDRVTIDPDAVLADAKADVLALASMGYRPPMAPKVPVPGTNGIAALTVAIRGMRDGGYLSEYDEHLGRTLARVLCGGDVPSGTMRSEQDLLDLEREAFLSLCGEEKTIQRILHMLETGKPLRN